MKNNSVFQQGNNHSLPKNNSVFQANTSPLIIDTSENDNSLIVPIEPPISSRDEASDALIPIETYEPKTCCDKVCCGSIANMAFGWPTGTVRGLIALIIAVVTVGVFAFLVVYFTIQNNANIALAGAGLLSTILAAVLGYYFGNRSASTPSTSLSSTTTSA